MVGQNPKNKVRLLDVILMTILLIIFFRGATVLDVVGKLGMRVIIGISLLRLIMGLQYGIKKKGIDKWLLIWLIYLAANCIWSIDRSTSISYLLYYIISVSLVLHPLDSATIDKAIRIMRVVCIIIAVSILASLIIPDINIKLFSFLYDAARINAIKKELADGYRSGIVGEKAIAAICMNVGIAIEFSDMFSTSKFKPSMKNVGIIILYYAALMLTGKRMLVLIPIIMLLLCITKSGVNNRWFTILISVVATFSVIGVILETIPQTQFILDRFLGSESLTSEAFLSGRGYLWEVAFDMFDENVLLGKGYGSYNAYINARGGYLGDDWLFYAHNCYVQILGECGIIGAILYLTMIGFGICSLVNIWKKFEYLLPFERKNAVFSLCIQVLFLLYALSGNVMYITDQLFFYFFAVGISTKINNDYKCRCILQ